MTDDVNNIVTIEDKKINAMTDKKALMEESEEELEFDSGMISPLDKNIYTKLFILPSEFRSIKRRRGRR